MRGEGGTEEGIDRTIDRTIRESDIFCPFQQDRQKHDNRGTVLSRAPIPPRTLSTRMAVDYRSSRVQRRNCKLTRQRKVIQKILKEHTCNIADREERKKQQHAFVLTASSSIPSISSSQPWSGLMQQILTGELASERFQPNPVFTDSTDDEAAQLSKSIAIVAMGARCRDALGVLRYLEILRSEKNGTAAGYAWLVNNSDRCGAVFELLASVPAIYCLDSIFQRTLLSRLDSATYPKDRVVFYEGDEQEMVWLILNGRIGITSEGTDSGSHRLWELHPGQVMGSLLLEKRLVTATCLEQCILLKVDSAQFRRTLEDPEAISTVAKKDFFRSVQLFRALGERDLDRLTSFFHLITLEAGKVLCQEGHRVDYLYLIKRGSCRLLKAFLPRQVEKDEGSKNYTSRSCAFPPLEPLSEDENTSPRAHRRVEEKRSGAHFGHGDRPVGEPRRRQQQRATVISSLRHFDVGERGRKDFVGEGGFTAAACAGACEREEQGDGDGVADGGLRQSLPWEARPGRKYLVSAITERGADVYAVKVSDLISMQSAAMKYCWMKGRTYHQMMERELNPESLGIRIERGVCWERTRRAIVLDNMRMDIVRKRMGRGHGGRDGGVIAALPID